MILDTIVDRKIQEVALLKTAGVSRPEQDIDPPRGFAQALTRSAEIALIAEVKKASPSKGVISMDFNPAAIAISYENGGADAVSVLTDESFFQGSLDYIVQVRRQVNLPVIRKDFIIHELQVHQARVYGADAILLIAAILDLEQLRDFHAMAVEMGMDVLVEVHDEKECEMALAAGSRLIGINNRDLRDFSVDLATTLRVKKEIPAEIPVVSESGIRDHQDVKRLTEHGVAAVLVGESLMRADDQAAALRTLMGW